MHPQGDDLHKLLLTGSKFLELRAQKQPVTEAAPVVRSQFGIGFNCVIDHELRGARGAEQLKQDAVRELRAGRAKLIDFVKKHRGTLRDQIDFCWELAGAAGNLERMGKSRVERLLDAATQRPAVCQNEGGRCAAIYDAIVSYQGLPAEDVLHSIYDVLRQGRRKGNALMFAGGKDTGKTTITEPAAQIFNTMPTPQSDSFCPLQDIRGHELLLWQDFRFCPGHPRKEEQGLRLDEGTWNRLVEGLPTLVGVAKTDGSRGDFVYHEDAPFIGTGPFKLTAFKNGRPDEVETEQLDCRMRYWMFSRPARPILTRKFKACPLCWSRWVLDGASRWQSQRGIPPDELMQKVLAAHLPPRPAALPPAAGPGGQSSGAAALAGPGCAAAPAAGQPGRLFELMSQLMAWRAHGMPTDAEFASAKRQLGLHDLGP